jgi:hypothetical protein
MKTLFYYGATFALVLQASPQGRPYETRLPVTDKSSADAPLRAVGNAMMATEITSQGIESTAELTSTLKNISSKSIVAFEVGIDLSSNYDGGEHATHRLDCFFDDSPLMPGATSDVFVGPRKIIVPWQRSNHPVTLDEIHSANQARADVSVFFVQFSDGTTFGASQWTSTLTVQRKNMIVIMGSLLRAFDEHGDQGLKSAIEKEQAKPGLPPELLAHLSLIQKKLRESGASVTAQYIKDRLANAQSRSKLLGATVGMED